METYSLPNGLLVRFEIAKSEGDGIIFQVKMQKSKGFTIYQETDT